VHLSPAAAADAATPYYFLLLSGAVPGAADETPGRMDDAGEAKRQGAKRTQPAESRKRGRKSIIHVQRPLEPSATAAAQQTVREHLLQQIAAILKEADLKWTTQINCLVSQSRSLK
jgi:hypothetical protein